MWQRPRWSARDALGRAHLHERWGRGPAVQTEEGTPVRSDSVYRHRGGPLTPDPPDRPSFQQRNLRVAGPETSKGTMSGAL